MVVHHAILPFPEPLLALQCEIDTQSQLLCKVHLGGSYLDSNFSEAFVQLHVMATQ